MIFQVSHSQLALWCNSYDAWLLIIRVFPKVDHNGNVARIVLVDQFLNLFSVNVLPKISQDYGKCC